MRFQVSSIYSDGHVTCRDLLTAEGAAQVFDNVRKCSSTLFALLLVDRDDSDTWTATEVYQRGATPEQPEFRF